MLHVFNVNSGNMLTFEVNLAMERVLELKNAISESFGVAAEKQVMLVNSGQALCDDERVYSYGAGTENNPVYLFDKACIERETPQTTSAFYDSKDFAKSIQEACSLPASYRTVETRTKLAMHLLDASRQEVRDMKSLVHDEHLMFQGWQAAVSNLADTVMGFRKRVDSMCLHCEAVFKKAKSNADVFQGMESVLSLLEQIPVLSSLLKSGKSLCSKSKLESSQVSLLHWIRVQCKNVSIQDLFSECKKKEGYLTQDRFSALVKECKKVESQASKDRMTEISGINERLAALDSFIVAAENQIAEQTRIAQGFLKNRETARELQNTSPSIDALVTLCESHVLQLRIMSENEGRTRETLRKCIFAKNELAENLHTRLRWLYYVQRSILNVDVKLSMFVQQLNVLEKQKEFLSQVKLCPTLYLTAIAEVVRRKHFADLYVQWANKAVADARIERDREIVKRKTFHENISGHFIQKLFQGLSDKPPSLSKKPLRSFDNNLPDITKDQLDTLSKLLPDYKDILQKSADWGMTFPHSSMVTPMSNAVNVQSTVSHVDASVGSSPQFQSVGTSMKTSPTASFALVGATSIAHNPPGGFVVTSVENVKQANLEEQAIEKNRNETDVKNSTNLPQRAFSSVTLTNEPVSAATTPGSSDSETVFPQISDIISPDSPPDSEFFSIMPGSFGNNTPVLPSALQNSGLQNSMQQQQSEISSDFAPINSLQQNALAFSQRKDSAINVGSLDSNSSTSYQKVDGLSSDEEMFHSFSSDQQDVKVLRKKLLQLQTDHDNILEKSRIEKEELNLLIRKLQGEIAAQQENQQAVESEFEKRWGESKLELDNVIKQLENERLERKKAWTEGSNLEKKLKTVEEESTLHRAQIEKLKAEICTKNDLLENLKIEINNLREMKDTLLIEKQQKIEEIITGKNEEIASVISSVVKLEKKLALSQSELSTADDRIQELEEMLSDRDHKEQDDAKQFLMYESKISELSRELNVAFESRQKSSCETTEARNKIAEYETSLHKANQQISSLKSMLADYETKLNDDKNKEHLLRNLRASQTALEMEKAELESSMLSVETELAQLKKDLKASQNEIQSLKLVAIQESKSHDDAVSKLKSTHDEEQQMMLKKLQQEIAYLNEKSENQIQELIQNNTKALQNKDQEMKDLETEIRESHRNELDEIEADRLALVASAQQDIESVREKLRASNRHLEIERKEAACLKDTMSENINSLQQECDRLLKENEKLSLSNTNLEDKLSKVQDDLQIMQEKEKHDLAIGKPAMTSSTDDEFESKRSKLDFGASVDMSSSIDSIGVESGNSSLPVEDHKRAIEVMRKNFEEDKKALENLYKRREEESAKRRQMIFNSAIQRVTATKDLEIKTLQEQIMVQSQMNPTSSITQSMMAPPKSMAVSLTQPSVSAKPQPPSAFSESPSESALAKAVETARDKDRLTVTNFHPGDTVLVCFNDLYQHFILLTTSRTLHFVHHDSLEKLGLSTADPESKKTMTFALLKDKEYCQARKAHNRFRVPVNTKFYRVKVEPMLKKE